MRRPWLTPGVFVGGLVPLGVLAWRLAAGTLGADPVAILLNQLGYLALVFLTGTLLVTPLRLAAELRFAVPLRRMLGLFAAFYASLHLLTYAVVDQGLAWGAIGADIVKRPFILAGFSAWLLLVPLAATSTDAAMRRLGKRWLRLHRLTYLAGVLAALHFVLRVKKDYAEPALFATLLAVGFAVRAAEAFRKRQR
jgi:sulfoxide reductase heme-binding subunit YedZ